MDQKSFLSAADKCLATVTYLVVACQLFSMVLLLLVDLKVFGTGFRYRHRHFTGAAFKWIALTSAPSFVSLFYYLFKRVYLPLLE